MESTITLAVTSNVWGGFIANWQRCGTPYLTGVFVTDVDGFAWRIGDGIVGPRRELIFMAVYRPCVPRAGFRYEETERGIRNHVDPRRGSPQTLPQYGHIFAAGVGESAETVEEFEGALWERHVQTFGLATLARDGTNDSFGSLGPVDLLRQRAATAKQYRPRDGLKQRPLLRRDEIRA